VRAALVVGTATVLVIVMALAPMSYAQGDTALPLTAKIMEGSSILQLWNTSKALYILSADEGGAKLLEATFAAAAPLPNLTVRSLALYAAQPQLMTVNSLKNPAYAAVILPGGEVSIINLTSSLTREFAIPGKALAATFINTTLFVLADTGGTRTLYAFAPSRLGWYEARLRVGNLLPTRQENIDPLDLVTVYTLDQEGLDIGRKALLVAESRVVNATAAATLAGVIFVEDVNGTLKPLANATVYVVDPILGAFVGSTVTTDTGSFNVPLPSSFEQVVIYVDINGTCYSFTVAKSNTIKTREDLYILRKPLVLTRGAAPTICPSRQRAYRLYLVEAGVAPLSPSFRLINYNVSTTDLRILLAFNKGDKLYLVIAQPLQSSADTMLAITVFDSKTLQQLANLTRYYYFTGSVTSATVSPDGRLLAVASSQGIILVLANMSGSYELVWSLNAGGPATALGIIPINRTDTYVIAAATSTGNLAIAYLDPARQIASPYTYSGGLPYIEVGYSFTTLAFRDGALVLGTSGEGLLAVASIANTVPNGTLSSLRPYMLTTASLRVVDELGRPIKSFLVNYTGYVEVGNKRINVISGTTVGRDGKALIKTIPILTVTLAVNPLDHIHATTTVVVNASTLLEGFTVETPLKPLNVKLVFNDTYTGGPPPVPIKVDIASEELHYNNTLIVTAANSTVTLSLKPGRYEIHVTDLSGIYYAPYAASFNVTLEKPEMVIDLERLDALVRVVFESRYRPKPNDKLIVTLETPDGRVLGRAEADAPTASTPRRIAFSTEYRGPAVIAVKPVPTYGEKPFYREMRVDVEVNSLLVETRLQLEPLPYILSVMLVDEAGKPVQTLFQVYPANTTRPIAEREGTKVNFTLTRGNYTIKAIPVSKKLPFPLYKTVEERIELVANTSIKLNTTTIRRLTNITIYDPFSPDRKLIDDISVILDGRLVATLAKGTEPTITLPLLLEGSNITFVSKHNIYQKLSKIVKPSNKTMKLAIPRVLIKAIVYVVNDVSQPVGGATVTFTGLDLRYSATTISTPDGAAEATVPYGSYRICVEASGYNPTCITASLTSAFKTTIVLAPKPLTVMMRYSNLIAITVFAIVMVVVVRTYFKKVLERFTTEEEF